MIVLPTNDSVDINILGKLLDNHLSTSYNLHSRKIITRNRQSLINKDLQLILKFSSL